MLALSGTEAAELAPVLVDFHNHILPAVDDGARDELETVGALRAMKDAGVGVIIASPHVSAASLVGADDAQRSYAAAIERGITVARTLAGTIDEELRVEPGAEILLDTSELRLDQPGIRLAATRFALIEFSLLGAPPAAERVLFRLRQDGWVPVLAHPERYAGLEVASVAGLRSAGIATQLNAGSLLGDYGGHVSARAWRLLENGFIDYICGDYHARGRFRTPAAFDAIRRRGGTEVCERLIDNGVRLTRDELPLSVPPLRRRRSFFSLFR